MASNEPHVGTISIRIVPKCATGGASPQSAYEVVDILFPKNDSSLQSVKGSPSNPKKVELPKYSKERICPWNKYHGSI